MKIYSFDAARENGLLKDVPVALAIGVFDGVHLGHQEIFTRLRSYCLSHPGVSSLVITFATNPKIRNLSPLDTLRLRCRYIESFSIDYTLVIDFSSDFSKMSGREFIRLLCTMCRPEAVIVGEDFKCGCPEDTITAKELSGAFHDNGAEVEVSIIPPVEDCDHTRISSTHIRSLVSQGMMEEVSRLAGSPYRYDLADVSFREKGCGYVFTPSGPQRLPEEGCYRASLVLDHGQECGCTLRILDREVELVPDCILDLVRADSVRILYKEKQE